MTEQPNKYNALENVVARLRLEKDRAKPSETGADPPAGIPQKQREAYEKQEDQKAYQRLTSKHAPRIPVLKNLIMAFLVGGLICTIGQLIWDFFKGVGLGVKEAGTASTMVMIFLGALLTGIGVYDQIGKVGGAGSIVPITGFANGIVSSAMEYKREGYVYGLGARIFTIAGPVLVYGFMVSVLVGLVYFLKY